MDLFNRKPKYLSAHTSHSGQRDDRTEDAAYATSSDSRIRYARKADTTPGQHPGFTRYPARQQPAEHGNIMEHSRPNTSHDRQPAVSISSLKLHPSPVVRYGIAIILTLVALVLTGGLWSVTSYGPFIFFIAAVAFSAWLGGFGPGMLTAGLSVLLSDYFLIKPLYSILSSPEDIVLFVVFGIIALLISWLEESRNRTEQALRDLKDELEIILQGAADGITAQDATGRTVFANQAAATLSGYASPAVMANQPVTAAKFEVYDEQGAPLPSVALPHHRVFQTGQSSSLIYKMRYKDTGEERWIGLRSAPVFDRNGSVRLAVSIQRDITATRQANVLRRVSEERLRRVLDNLAAFVAVLTPNGTVIEANRAALSSASLPSGQVLNQPFDALPIWNYSVEVQQQVRDVLRRAAGGATVRQDMTLRLGENQFMTVDLMVAPVQDSSGAVEYLVASGIDVTERNSLTRQLAEGRQRLEDILNSIPGVVYEVVANPETGLQEVDYVSDYAEKLFGYPMQQWHETPNLWYEIVTPDDVTSARGQIDRDAPRGIHGPLQFKGKTQDGRTLHLESYNIRTLNANGERIGTRGVVLDVSERHRREEEVLTLTALIERQRGRLDRIIANMPGIVYESSGTDFATQRVDFISAYTEKMLGYPLDEWKNKPDFWKSIIHPEDWTMLTGDDGAASKQPVIQFRCFAKDGRTVHLEAHSSPVMDEHGQHLGVCGVMMDITERKQIEESIVHYTDDLRRSNEELEQFAYVASHDLQEPLRMVASYLQLIEQRYASKLDDDAGAFIAFAVDGATRMKTLINDLLAYSRVQRNRSNFERVDMAQVLEQVLYNIQFTAEDLNAEITHDPLPEITANEGHMAQLLQNLLGNALKFHSEAAPRIHIGVEKQAHAWQFSVKDNGIGIEAEFLGRIFVIFQRLHSRDRYPGTGIGLAICKKIVENHGGEIRAESQPGEGTTFYFTIPIEMKESLRTYGGGRGNIAGGR